MVKNIQIGGKQTDITGMKITVYPMGFINPKYKAKYAGAFNNEDMGEEATERRTKSKNKRDKILET